MNSGGSTVATASGIEVEAADEVLLLVSIATNFVDYQTLTADEKATAAQYLSAVEGKTYEALLNDHVTAFGGYFGRVALDLGSSSSTAPTDERIAAFAGGDDPELTAMYYQFGRYLLISSSRPGGQPANLQGIWNDQTSPPWDVRVRPAHRSRRVIPPRGRAVASLVWFAWIGHGEEPVLTRTPSPRLRESGQPFRG